MPVIKLTQKNVDKLRAPDPSGKQVAYWDGGHRDALKGFGVVVSGKTSTISYIVQKGVAGRTPRVTIGQANVLDAATAREKATELLAQMALGTDPKGGKRGIPTLDAAFKAFVEARQSSLSPNSIAAYSNHVNKHMKPWLNTPLNLITSEMVERQHRKLGEDVGPAAANLTMRTLRLVWNFTLEKQPTLGISPVRLRKQWHRVAPRTRLVKGDQLPAFYQAVCALENKVHRDYLLTLLFTGMRRREAAALRWDHIDFAAKTMTVPAANTKSRTKLDLPLSDFMFALLVARRALGNASGWVFPSNSKSGHLAEPKYIFGQIEEACGIRVSAHDLRRTFITTVERCPISPVERMALVNHSMGGGGVHADYVQLTVEDLREPTQVVCDRLKALCGIEEAVGANVARLR